MNELLPSIGALLTGFKLFIIRLLRYVSFVHYYDSDSFFGIEFDIIFCLFYSNLRDQRTIMDLKSPPDIQF